jgi:hypothetical protein
VERGFRPPCHFLKEAAYRSCLTLFPAEWYKHVKRQAALPHVIDTKATSAALVPPADLPLRLAAVVGFVHIGRRCSP